MQRPHTGPCQHERDVGTKAAQPGDRNPRTLYLFVNAGGVTGTEHLFQTIAGRQFSSLDEEHLAPFFEWKVVCLITVYNADKIGVSAVQSAPQTGKGRF